MNLAPQAGAEAGVGAEAAPGEMIGTGLSPGSTAGSASSITVKHVDHSEDASPSVLQIGTVLRQSGAGLGSCARMQGVQLHDGARPGHKMFRDRYPAGLPVPGHAKGMMNGPVPCMLAKVTSKDATGTDQAPDGAWPSMAWSSAGAGHYRYWHMLPH